MGYYYYVCESLGLTAKTAAVEIIPILLFGFIVGSAGQIPMRFLELIDSSELKSPTFLSLYYNLISELCFEFGKKI